MKPSNLFYGLLLTGPALAGNGGGVFINEIRIDQPSSDTDEYVEFMATPGLSLDGMTYIVIGDGSGGSGVIESVTALTGTVGTSGYFVVAESSFSLGTADQTGTLNFENGDNVTHLLVSDFTGSNGDDLDTDDDGVLDSSPWSSILDSVALIDDPDGGDQVYSDTTVGPDGTNPPAHPFVCSGLGWTIGEYDIAAGDDTPGADNACATSGEFETYCVSFPNSASFDGAQISWNGSGNISDNDTTISVKDCPNTFGLFFYGDSADFQVPFGNGALCVGDIQDRWGVAKAAGNQAIQALDFTGSGPESGFVVGQEVYIQYWFRDPGQGAWNNTSNALKMTLGG